MTFCPSLDRLAFLTGLLLLLGSRASSPAADLFVQTVIPGWTNIPPYALLSAWGDYDGDGLPDVYVGRTRYADWTGTTTNLLYRNNGDGSFTCKLASEVGPIVSDRLSFGQAQWIDVNEDGHLDLWVMAADWSSSHLAVSSPLYLNRGDGTFAVVTAGALTEPRIPWGFSSWADFDNDGRLDVIIPLAWATTGVRTNALLHGRADVTFELVTDGPVVTDQMLNSNNSIWGDLDNDGDADLLLANNAVPNRYYRNDGGGRFTRMTNSILEHTTYKGAHHTLGDLDRDGDLDIVATGFDAASFVFLNDGAGVFTLSQSLPRIGASLPYLGDYDNDGDLDCIVSEASVSPHPLVLFRNDGLGAFTQQTEAFTGLSGSWVVGPWIDFDNNGFLDLFLGRNSGVNQLVWLYRNQGNGNHWLKFKLVGTHSHRSAIGAKVRVRASLGGRSLWQMRELGGNIVAEDGGRVHFGLGNATRAEEVRVEWPSGIVQEIPEVSADQFLTITEPAAIRLSCVRLSDGLRIECQGAMGTTYELQISDTLRSWTIGGTLTTDGNGHAAIDLTSGQTEARFYRAIKR